MVHFALPIVVFLEIRSEVDKWIFTVIVVESNSVLQIIVQSSEIIMEFLSDIANSYLYLQNFHTRPFARSRFFDCVKLRSELGSCNE